MTRFRALRREKVRLSRSLMRTLPLMVVGRRLMTEVLG